MKLASDTRSIDRSGNMTETGFSIKATGKAFAILSSGLYSDKVAAIIRELSCNAYDSHIAAGKSDLPIEIKLPTALDPTFYVKDFGLGLSHDDVIGLYTTYFESTKADSNDFIGALGLGSKSPFSYVSTFNVESRFNGKKMMYTAFINEQSVPSITKLGEGPTDEDNGLTVSLAVKREDVDEFRTTARRAFAYFDPIPNVKGIVNFVPEQIKHTTVGSNWKIRDSSSSFYGPQVVQGVVAYPLDRSLLITQGLSENAQTVLKQNIDLFVPIGSVEVAASREALSYTKDTIANLKAFIEQIVSEYKVAIQTEFDKCESIADARDLHFHKRRTDDLFRNLIGSGTKFKFGNELIETSFKVTIPSQLLKNVKVSLHRMNDRMYGKRTFSTAWVMGGGSGADAPINFSDLCYRRDTLIVVDDLSNRHAVRAFAEKNENSYVLVFSATKRGKFDQAEIDPILVLLGNPSNVVYTSTVQFSKPIPTTNGAYRAKKVNEVMRWDGFKKNNLGNTRRVYSRLTWNNETIDLNDGGVYVPIERFSPINSDGMSGALDYVYSALRTFWKDDVVIYGLNEKQVKAIDTSKWVNAFDQYTSLVKSNVAMIERAMLSSTVIAHVPYSIRQAYFGSNRATVNNLLNDGVFKQYLDTVESYVNVEQEIKQKFGPNVSSASLIELARLYSPGIRPDSEKHVDNVNKLWAKVLMTYPMIKLVDLGHTPSIDSVKTMIDYVNTVQISQQIAAELKQAA